MKTVLLLLFIFGNISFSQNYYKLYSRHLPKDHLKFFSEEAINDQLSRDVSISPELIYWRLYYYTRIISDQDYSGETNGMNFIRTITVSKIKERNDWIIDQVKILDQKYKGHEYYFKIYDLLTNQLIKDSEIQLTFTRTDTYSKNLDDYYQYILLSQNSELEYDSSKVYSELVTDVKMEIKADIKTTCESLKSNFQDIDKSFQEKIFRYYYLIREDPGAFTDVPTMLIEYIINDNSIKKENSFSVQVGYLNKYISSTTNVVTSNFPEINEPFEIATVKDIHNFSFQVRYKYFIRNISSVFSYINSSLLFNVGSRMSPEYKKFYYRRSEGVEYTSDFYNFSKIKTGDNTSYGLYLKFTTPVFIPSRYLNFDIGLMSGVEMNTLSFDITYDHSRVKVNFDGTNYHNQNLINAKNLIFSDKRNSYNFYISPLISLNFNILKLVSTEVFVCYNASGVNIGLSF